MTTFRLTGFQSAFLRRLWELSPAGAEHPAIKIDLEDNTDRAEMPKDPLAIDLRMTDDTNVGPLTETDVTMGATIIVQMLRLQQRHPDYVTGTSETGTLFSRAIAGILKVQHLEFNGQRSTPQRFNIGDDVLIVSDVLGNGDRELVARRIIQTTDGHVLFATLFDKQQGGREALKRKMRQDNLLAAMTITQAMLFYERHYKITRAERDAVLAYPAILADYRLHSE